MTTDRDILITTPSHRAMPVAASHGTCGPAGAQRQRLEKDI